MPLMPNVIPSEPVGLAAGQAAQRENKDSRQKRGCMKAVVLVAAHH